MAFTRADNSTFDHQCENPRCRATQTNVPHTGARLWDPEGTMIPGHYMLIIDCPTCGTTSESLNTALTADDVQNGHARRRFQAACIRRLQAARGLPML